MINEYNIAVEARQHGFPHITVMDEAIPTNFCKQLIGKFEANEDQVQVETELKNVRHFMEVNVSQCWPDEHETMVNLVQQAWKTYRADHEIVMGAQWPTQFGFEQFRMKRYLPNGKDEFAFHTDVGNYASARRFLAFLWYLNTPESGGATQFGYHQEVPIITVPAKRGRLLMFPPLWMYPHWGCKVSGGPKYIMTGYLHYI